MTEQDISRTVGLWLAEGSTTSKSEITFTNNQPSLIRFFHNIILQNLEIENDPRIYVYRKNDKMEVKPLLKKITHRFYIHPMCTRPYFIYRISGVRLVRRWFRIVDEIKNMPELYKFILQGFFAGEGNVKYSPSSRSRVLRISQGKPNDLVEKMLENLGVSFTYSSRERSYVICGRENLERLLDLEVSKLHPVKDRKFKSMLSSYKQRHLKRGLLKKKIINLTENPISTKEIANIVNKSESRVCRTLSKLSNEGDVDKFRVGSNNYWVKSDRNLIIISETKSKILKFLHKPRRVYEISQHLNVSWKSPFKRLKELERLNLVKRRNSLWYKTPTNKEVITYRNGNWDR